MDQNLWDKCQILVDAGVGHLVKHLYIEELKKRLTSSQLEKLGDLSPALDHFFVSKANMQHLIDTLVELSKCGAILGPRKD